MSFPVTIVTFNLRLVKVFVVHLLLHMGKNISFLHPCREGKVLFFGAH